MGFGSISTSVWGGDRETELRQLLRVTLFDSEEKGLNKVKISGRIDIKFNNQIIVYGPNESVDYESSVDAPKKTWIVTDVVRNESATLEIFKGNYLPTDTHLDQCSLIEETKKYRKLGVKIGSYYISSNAYYVKVVGVEIEAVIDSRKTHDMRLVNPHRKCVYKDVFVVRYEEEDQAEMHPTYGNEQTCDIDNFLRKDLIEINEPTVERYEDRISHYLETGDMISLSNDVVLIGDNQFDMNEEGGLVVTNSTEHLQLITQSMMEKRDNATLYARSTKRHIRIKTSELNKKVKQELAKFDEIKSQLAVSVKSMGLKIKKITKLVTTIEIFAGLSEEIKQIATGEDAPDDEVINLRQMKLFIDEEMAVIENEGIEFKDLEEFHDWVATPKNLNQIAPDQKCVVIMSIRRKNKRREHLNEHPFQRMGLENMDNLCFILIRNGGNAYGIWSDHIHSARLFPKRAELQKLFNEMMDSEVAMAEADNEYTQVNELDRYDKIEDALFAYKKNVILLHGIIARTEIFPVSPLFNMMDTTTHKGVVQMVYDEEDTLSDGRPSFDDWLSDVNQSITVGSRIFYAGALIGGNADANSSRFTKYWSNQWSAPRMPMSGVYMVKPIKGEKSDRITKTISWKEHDNIIRKEGKVHNIIERRGSSVIIGDELEDGSKYTITKVNELSISYDEGESDKKDLYAWMYEKVGLEQTNKSSGTWTRFRIYNSDSFIINYDALVLEDIEYYINSRIHRKDYMHIMSVLVGLKNNLIKELAKEKEFVDGYKFILMTETGLKEEHCVDAITEAIVWWKTTHNTVIKRPFDPDYVKNIDAVKLRCLRTLKKKFKLKIDVSNNSSNQVLITSVEFNIERHYGDDTKNIVLPKRRKVVFYSTGLNKKQFVDKIFICLDGIWSNDAREHTTKRSIILIPERDNEWNDVDYYSKAELKRNMSTTTDATYVKTVVKGEISHVIKDLF